MKDSRLLEIYNKLLEKHGPQKWWPVNYGFRPKELEICIGAILTQNTNWRNVEKALANLSKSGCETIEDLLALKDRELERLVQPSGFYKQKAARLRGFLEAVTKAGGLKKFLKTISREELLSLKGIGPETADSILLYAAGRPFFVVDAYTRRVFSALGIVDKKIRYEELRSFFEERLPKDVGIYKEFHALIVKEGKLSNFKP
jgi:endonuclease-3 related protein